MKVTLIGLKDIQPFETSDGNTVDGVKIFFAYPDENTYGNMADSKFISRDMFNSFDIKIEELLEHFNEIIDVEFSPKQKVIGITI